MRKIFTLLCCLAFMAAGFSQINLAGNYGDTGYFFHPSSPRSIQQTKTIKQIGTNKYEMYLGDLGPQGYSFSFEMDGSYHFINWTPLYSTPASPSSNFMTDDNPGGINYTVSPLPGQSPFLQGTFDNYYDPISKTLYMHFGYGVGSSDQNGFSRQVYEKLSYLTPPSVTSFSPITGTTGTPITIHGLGFSNAVSTYNGVLFNGFPADSIEIVSDSELVAWVGAGGSGEVSVTSSYGTGVLSGFTYIPLPAITNSGWTYVGKPGFTSSISNTVNIVVGKNNVPYTLYTDMVNHLAWVQKFDGTNWVNVGGQVSDAACVQPLIVLDSNNVPFVAYLDSAYYTELTLKQFDGTNWITIGNTTLDNLFLFNGNASSQYSYSGAIDSSNNFYLVYLNSNGELNAFKYDGVSLTQMGVPAFANVNNGFADITIDKKTGTPYVAFDDQTVNNAATVMKFDGVDWVNVGTAGYSFGSPGVFGLKIKIDTAGAPITLLQDDNGFERASVYKFDGTNMDVLGIPYFSKSHIYAPSLTIDKNSKPYILYLEATYNNQGSVLTYTDSTGWTTVGARGFIPQYFNFDRTAIDIDGSNNPIIAFSDKTQGGKVSVMTYPVNPLPLRLLAFTAYSKNNMVQTAWQTAQEEHGGYFNVQRSVDGVHFTTIGTQKAKGRAGSNYSFSDSRLADATTIYYRLEMVHVSGEKTYSAISTVKIKGIASEMSLYPVPVNNALKVQVQAQQPTMAVLQITGIDGKLFHTQQVMLTKGNNVVNINTANLAKGNYVLQLKGGLNEQKVFIKE